MDSSSSALLVAYLPPSESWIPFWQWISSVIGIGIAIAVPWYTQRRATILRTNERRRKGHAIAVLLQRDVKQWRGHFDPNFAPSDAETQTPPNLSFIAQAIYQSMVFWVPKSISDAAKDLEYLDETGERLLECMYNNQIIKADFEILQDELKRQAPDAQRVETLARQFFPAFRRQTEQLDAVVIGLDGRFR